MNFTPVTCGAYIVTGVIFVYNGVISDLVKIVFCVFAVFGMYSFVREAVCRLAKRPRLFVGVYLDASMPRDRVENDIALAAEVAARCKYTHVRPILLTANDAEIEGSASYEIYQKKGYHA